MADFGDDDSDSGDGGVALDTSDAGAPVSLNDQVKNWAFNKISQQVGDGECFALADQALKAAGAKSAADFGAVTADADYKWGTAVSTLNDALPGDIIQFRNFKIVTTTTTVTTTTHADGSVDTQTSTDMQTLGRPHHTAIIWSQSGSGVANVLEQNVDPGGKVVQNDQLNFSDSTSSTSNVSQSGSDTTKTDTTVTIKVTGTKWIFRPTK